MYMLVLYSSEWCMSDIPTDDYLTRIGKLDYAYEINTPKKEGILNLAEKAWPGNIDGHWLITLMKAGISAEDIINAEIPNTKIWEDPEGYFHYTNAFTNEKMEAFSFHTKDAAEMHNKLNYFNVEHFLRRF